MTHQEILTKAITQAIAGGWDAEIKGKNLNLLGVNGEQTAWYGIGTWGSYNVIYNHDFAKALWGEEGYTDTGEPPEVWQYHLQMMVISDDPIAYLGKHL